MVAKVRIFTLRATDPQAGEETSAVTSLPPAGGLSEHFHARGPAAEKGALGC